MSTVTPSGRSTRRFDRGDELGAAAVVERDRQHHAGVVGGVGDRLADRPLDVARCAGHRRVERPPDPLDADVQLVEFGDPSEQLLVQPEDVADLGARALPVLGGEPEHGQPPDVALDGDADQPGEVLLALGVALGAREPAAAGPAAVAVHDAGDVQRRCGALVGLGGMGRHGVHVSQPASTGRGVEEWGCGTVVHEHRPGSATSSRRVDGRVALGRPDAPAAAPHHGRRRHAARLGRAR